MTPSHLRRNAARYFKSGATRDTQVGKIDPEGFLDPLVVAEFSRYMDKHRVQTDKHLRDSDNWQKGFTRSATMKSLWRHFLDLWLLHRGHPPVSKDHRALYVAVKGAALRGTVRELEAREQARSEVLCALWFNVAAYLREVILRRSHKS